MEKIGQKINLLSIVTQMGKKQIDQDVWPGEIRQQQVPADVRAQ